MKKGPLSGIKVIDASNVIAGPTAAKLLADYGADVIKLEHPKYGDSLRDFGFKKGDTTLWWKVLNRNKKAITLNLSHKEGQEILKELIKDTDVLIQNYRPGKMEEWGLGYEDLKKINSRLIELDISGFGSTGPYRNKPGFGTVAEAMSGFSFVNGFPDKPPLMPTNPLADSVTGVYGAMAVAFALWYRDCRDENREGQSIDLSLYESLFSLMDCMVTDYDQLGIIQKRTGNMPENTGGPRNAYYTSDGKWMAVSANSRNTIERTLKIIGLENDKRLGNMDNIVENLPEIDVKIAEWVETKTAKEVQQIFDEAGAVVGPVYSVEDIVQDEQYISRESIIEIPDDELGSFKMQGLVAKFSKTPGAVEFGGQKMGQSNEDIYEKQLKLSKEEIDSLKKKGAI